MKRIVLTLIAILLVASPMLSQNVDIPDTAFLNALIELGVDTNGDGQISYVEAEAGDSFNLNLGSKGISNLTGIKAFTNSSYIDCADNGLTSLDVSNLPALTFLCCWGNELTSINVANDTALTWLDCWGNQLTSLDVSSNISLRVLLFSDNKLTNLDISSNKEIRDLRCSDNELTYLDVSNNPKLAEFNCSGNKLENLDISNNKLVGSRFDHNTQGFNISSMPTLKTVCVWENFNIDSIHIYTAGSPNVLFTTECFYDTIVYIPDTAFLYALIEEGVDTNGDSLISYKEAETIISLEVTERGITDMTGLQSFINLDTLFCDKNQITTIDVSSNLALRYLDVSIRCPWGNCHLGQEGTLITLDVSNNTKLEVLYCWGQLLTSLDVSNNTALTRLSCYSNPLTSLDLSNNNSLIEIQIWNTPPLKEVCVWEMPFPASGVNVDTTDSPNVYFTTECTNQIVSIHDTAFLYALIEEGVDTNGDSLISYVEAESVTSLDVSEKAISDLTGIEAFIILDELTCSENELTSLDVSFNIALEHLSCSRNQLTSLDVSNCTDLIYLDLSAICSWPGCWGGKITTLDLSNNTMLEILDVSGNLFTSLDLTNNNALVGLRCIGNQLTSLDVSNNTALVDLICWNNQLSNLDVSNNIALEKLDCCGNQLTSLDISNNTALDLLDLMWMPSLLEVCVWTMPFPPYGVEVRTTDSPNVFFTTECALGLEEQSLSGLSLFPNPVYKLLSIETENPDHYSIEITSLNGQLLHHTAMEGTSHQIDLTSFQSGVYFITIRSEDFVTTRKIIKL